MKMRQVLCRAAVSAAVLLCLGSSGAWAQTPAVRSRVVEPVDDSVTVRLPGNVHPLAKAQFDQGALPDSQPLTHMMLLLQRSPEQELALRQLLDAQLTKSSSSYHTWLTPAQFGKQFGPSDSDVQAVTDWLSRQGFRVNKVAAGKTVIDFDGNVAQVRSAFHTEIHRFTINGQQRFANVSDPAIPAALASVVVGPVALHNFPKHSNLRNRGAVARNKETGKVEPLFTTTGGAATYLVGPGDWNTIYSNTTGATGGTNETIAIVADSNINTQDVVNFRSIFGLPAYGCVKSPDTFPTTCTGASLSVIVNGPDPLLTADEGEADLDTEWAGAIAPAAHIILVVSEDLLSTEGTGQISAGIDLSALFIVDNNVAPILSESFGQCEPFLGVAGVNFYNSLWEQAAAQGITVSVSAGDNGSASCDPLDATDPTEPAATLGVAVNGIASTPFNVAVGGTDFDPLTTNANASSYWTTTPGTVNSATKYIPEITWDESTCAFDSSSACNTVDTTGNQLDLSAGGGGPSNCFTENGAQTLCTGGFPKPSFQGTLTPADSVRDLPDVSFFASAGGPVFAGNGNFSGAALVICESDALPTGVDSCNLNSPYEDFSEVGGTSAAAPAFAAVMALVDATQTSPANPDGRQGNANYVLYALAAKDTTYYLTGKCETSNGGTAANAGTPQAPNGACVFNDVNKGNIAVACVPGDLSVVTGFATWCSTVAGGTFGLTTSTSGLAFGSGPEYDYATGLGSINVGNLLTSWISGFRTPTTTTVMSTSGATAIGTTFTANVTVAPVPTGTTEDVSLIALSSQNVVLGTFGPFPLTAGAATPTTTLLPVGTTSVEASYSGDSTHAPSTSAAKPLNGTVSGAGYTAQTTLLFVNGNTPPQTATSSQNFAYGTAYSLAIVVGRQGGQTQNIGGTTGVPSCALTQPKTVPPFPCPTGTITLTDNGTASTDFPNGITTLNNAGIAEDQYINLSATVNSTSPGVHKLVATYAGDANYAAGNPSNTLQITIQKATPVGLAVGSSLASITPGTSVTLTAYVVTSSNGAGPGGSISFAESGTSLGSGNCQSVGGNQDVTPPITAISAGTAYCVVSVPTTGISNLPPMGNPGTPAIPRAPLVVALLSLLLFVLGLRWVPQARKRAYTYAGLLAIALLVGVVAGCGGGGGGTTPPGSHIATITAVYNGDANYNGANGTTQITVQQ